MLPPRHNYLLGKIKNRRLLLIVWDVLNNNLTENTITVARQLLFKYKTHKILNFPDLVKAVAAWNSDLIYSMKSNYILAGFRVETGINQPELSALIDDMIGEIIEYRIESGFRNDFPNPIFK